MLISTALFSLGGWPFTSQVIVLVGVIVALSANAANPAAFAAAAVIAVPIAILLAGVTEFLVEEGSTNFPFWRSPWRQASWLRPFCYSISSKTTPNRICGDGLLPDDALAV